MQARSGIAPARPAPSTSAEPAPRGPRPRSNESGTWFEAPCAFGSMRLCVRPGAPTAHHAAEAAIFLRDVEPLLAAIDDWTGADGAWRWVEAPAHGVPGALASARWRGASQEHECVVSWPWALLRSLPQPRPELAAQLHWPLVAAVLVLARLQIELTELELLEPGGAVLVPQALQPPWRGAMRRADEAAGATAGVAVDLSTPWRPRLCDGDAPGAAGVTPLDPARAACELRLDLPLRVSAQRLAGWPRAGEGGEFVHLAESGLRAALWRCATSRHAEQGLAGGRLMPWGDGWAFAVETLETRPETPG